MSNNLKQNKKTMTKKFALKYQMKGNNYAIISSPQTYLRDCYVLASAGASCITSANLHTFRNLILEEDEDAPINFPFDEERKFQEEYMWQEYSIDGYNNHLMREMNCTEIYDEKPLLNDKEEKDFLEFCAEQKAMELLDLMPHDKEYQILITKALQSMLL